MNTQMRTITRASWQEGHPVMAANNQNHPPDQNRVFGLTNSEAEESRLRAAYARRKHTIPEGRYSCLNYGNLLMEQELERHFLLLLNRLGCGRLRDKQILDVGCGTGSWLHKLIGWGAQPKNMFGLDLLEERITRARQLLPNEVKLTAGSATHLEFADRTFDLIFQFTVFSSILDCAVRRQVADEMLRVLKPDGYIVWHDLFVNNPLNVDLRALRKGAIRELFPDCQTNFRRVTLIPPVARALGPLSPQLCQILSSMKVFSTHYLVFITRITSA